jgi:[lysine-biosynthesis-protein LysW]--L-2-aminoadipate ligase
VATAVPVAVLASRLRWEEKAILDALGRMRVRATAVDTRTLRLDLDGPAPWLVAADREIARTRALYAALAAEALGTRMVNPARAIEVCDDRLRCATALRADGLPTPRSVLALTPEAAREAAAQLGYPVVLKGLSGSWGRRVSLLRDPDALDAVLDHCAALPHPRDRVVRLEEFVGDSGRDLRVVVVGGHALGAAARVGTGWRTNARLGGRSFACRLDPPIARLAERAAAAVGAEIAGVDLIEDATGRPYLLEVNAGVEFRQFASATGIDVATAIAGHLRAAAAAGPAAIRAVAG